MKSVDVIIPVLNEGRFIAQCLQSVLAFERPPGLIWRVFVVDGGSVDKTLDAVRLVAKEHPELELLNNPGRIQSCALNIALRRGNGDYVLRLDAHATYPKDYLTQCIQSAVASDADNVGGIFKTLPGSASYQAQVVQAVTTHKFGIGNAEFRLRPEPGPADTVPYGFFKRSVFETAGYFDERLVRNQDYELNRRIVAGGGSIWLNPKIVVHYHNMPTIWGFLKKQFTKEGPYNAYLWYLAPYARALRHGITGAFAAGVVGGLVGACFSRPWAVAFLSVMGLYAALACMAAIQQALRYRCAWHVLTLPAVFFGFHFIHGLGFLSGLLRLALGIAPVQRMGEPWPGYGAYRIQPAGVAKGAVDSGCTLTGQKHRVLSTAQRFSKRSLDLMVAIVGLLILWPLMGFISAVIRCASRGPIFFLQQRIGCKGRVFDIIKFRTMTLGAQLQGTITTATDRRVTPFGRVLRKYKLDECPQLWNVLVGEMSLVGPRPDVPGYADRLPADARQILALRPGITGPASLLFRDEERLLALAPIPQVFNDAVIYPEKVRINLEYLENWSFWRDIGYLVATLLPGVARWSGLERRLGLDCGAFRKRMEQTATRQRT